MHCWLKLNGQLEWNLYISKTIAQGTEEETGDPTDRTNEPSKKVRRGFWKRNGRRRRRINKRRPRWLSGSKTYWQRRSRHTSSAPTSRRKKDEDVRLVDEGDWEEVQDRREEGHDQREEGQAWGEKGGDLNCFGGRKDAHLVDGDLDKDTRMIV